ncbi:hypothetical protein S7711_07758, partial [Stachybotrys chartarum IBT 7711]
NSAGNFLRQRSKQSHWPNPAASIGLLIDTSSKNMGRNKAWHAQGPAQDAFESYLRLDLESSLMNSGIVQRATLFLRAYMIGPTEEKAVPTVMVCCINKKTRDEAERHVRRSRLVEQQGFALGRSALLLEAKAPLIKCMMHAVDDSDDNFLEEDLDQILLDDVEDEIISGSDNELQFRRGSGNNSVMEDTAYPSTNNKGDDNPSNLQSRLSTQGGKSLEIRQLGEIGQSVTQVYAVTSNGPVSGVLLPGTTSSFAPGGGLVRRMYAMELEVPLERGDCGSAVIDGITVTYVFKDIQDRTGMEVSLVTKTHLWSSATVPGEYQSNYMVGSSDEDFLESDIIPKYHSFLVPPSVEVRGGDKLRRHMTKEDTSLGQRSVSRESKSFGVPSTSSLSTISK